jgi:hypothetical protein
MRDRRALLVQRLPIIVLRKLPAKAGRLPALINCPANIGGIIVRLAHHTNLSHGSVPGCPSLVDISARPSMAMLLSSHSTHLANFKCPASRAV